MEYRVARRNLRDMASTGRQDRAHRDVEQILTDAFVRRFHLRAGFTTTSTRALEETRQFLLCFLRKLIVQSVAFASHGNRYNILVSDVLRACKQQGIRLYGYDDMVVISSPSGDTEYHVTEMVEISTTFSRDRDEPDHEPTGVHQKTDFVANQLKWEADWTSDCDADSDWYGDSDADSDSSCSDEEDEEDEEGDIEEEPDVDGEELPTDEPSPENGSQSPVNVEASKGFIESLRTAQDIVDGELLITSADIDIEDSDSPMGQGYYSDCDGDREPSYREESERSSVEEDSRWRSRGSVMDYDLVFEQVEEEPALSQAEGYDDFDEGNVYVLTRQVFLELFHGELFKSVGLSLTISAVALSALHNVSEQYLHKALTSGVLQSKVVALLMETELESAVSAQIDADQKLAEMKKEKAEMAAAFKSKEMEMQDRIAELENRLRKKLPSEEDPASPRKRKALQKIDENTTIQSSSTSLASTLRSRLHDYDQRKKAKLAPR